MPKVKVDPRNVMMMAETGFTARDISKRLPITTRHARRIIGKDHNLKMNKDERLKNVLGTDSEKVLWRYYRSLGESYEQIGLRFGRTKQAIQQHLETNN